MLLEMAQTKIGEFEITVVFSSPATLYKNVERVYILVRSGSISVEPIEMYTLHTQVRFEVHQGYLHLRRESWLGH